MVYYYHKLLSSNNLSTINTECRKGFRGCVGCKKELINELMNFLGPIQEKRRYYEAHPEEVEQIVQEGTEAARKQAKNVMSRVKDSMNLNYFKK